MSLSRRWSDVSSGLKSRLTLPARILSRDAVASQTHMEVHGATGSLPGNFHFSHPTEVLSGWDSLHDSIICVYVINSPKGDPLRSGMCPGLIRRPRPGYTTHWQLLSEQVFTILISKWHLWLPLPPHVSAGICLKRQHFLPTCLSVCLPIHASVQHLSTCCGYRSMDYCPTRWIITQAALSLMVVFPHLASRTFVCPLGTCPPVGTAEHPLPGPTLNGHFLQDSRGSSVGTGS